MTKYKDIQREGGFGPFDGTERAKNVRYDASGNIIKKASNGTAGGHIKTILQSIGDHLLYYLSNGLFSGFRLQDVQVFLPLFESSRIQGSRFGSTAIILANNMKSTMYPLSPGIMRQRFQLPIVFTIFSQNEDRRDDAFVKDGTVSQYDIMSAIPMIMRKYDGSQYGVMQVSVNNIQISRNPVNIENYDEIIQANMTVTGIMDYSSRNVNEGKKRLIVEVNPVDIFGEIKQGRVHSEDFAGISRGISVTGVGLSALDGATSRVSSHALGGMTVSGAKDMKDARFGLVNTYELDVTLSSRDTDELGNPSLVISDANLISSLNIDKSQIRYLKITDIDNADIIGMPEINHNNVRQTEFDAVYSSRVGTDISRVSISDIEMSQKNTDSKLSQGDTPVISAKNNGNLLISLINESDKNGSIVGSVIKIDNHTSQMVHDSYNDNYYSMIYSIRGQNGNVNSSYSGESSISVTTSDKKSGIINDEAGKIFVTLDDNMNRSHLIYNIIRQSELGIDNTLLK